MISTQNFETVYTPALKEELLNTLKDWIDNNNQVRVLSEALEKQIDAECDEDTFFTLDAETDMFFTGDTNTGTYLSDVVDSHAITLWLPNEEDEEKEYFSFSEVLFFNQRNFLTRLMARMDVYAELCLRAEYPQ
jgi:hypothetical protein